MPRMARKMSWTKVYHVILRGNGKQDIFLDEQDYKKFIKEIVKTKEKYGYELYAYCLMTNHVHLVIYDKNDMLSKIFQSLAVSYSAYFSKKYEKVGHLFQNRFLSKEVETSKYLMQVCRYIHQNPMKAKILNVDNYKWSSYKEYITKPYIVDTKILMKLFGENKKDAVKNFIVYNKGRAESINDYLEFEFINKMADEQAKGKIKEILEMDDLEKLKEYNFKIRDEKIRKLKNLKGVSKSQISRVLGLNRKIIERALK